MVLIPLSVFYISFYIIFRGDRSMLGWSGIISVISVQFVIASYVIMAWNEDKNDKKDLNYIPPIKKEYRTD